MKCVKEVMLVLEYSTKNSFIDEYRKFAKKDIIPGGSKKNFDFLKI